MSEQSTEKTPHPPGCTCPKCAPTIPMKAMSKAEARGFEPTKPVGIFLVVFGCAVIGAVLIDMSFADKMINAVSGGVLVGIGAFCYAIGWFRTRRRTRKSG